MKTLPELIKEERKDPRWAYYFRRWLDDFLCFILDHNYRGFDLTFNDWDWVCSRCCRIKNKGGFYHNWEMKRGPAARCHDHNK
jgi:hypothetical protein